MTDAYLLCGWKVRSDIPLPELPAWRGAARPADLRIRLGAVPALPGCPSSDERGLHLPARDDCLLQIGGVARYRARGGAEVVVQPVLPATAPEIRIFLLGSILGFICHQRGVLPLHASAVRIGGRAVAICGPSGAGKSTLAAALAARGHGMMADDVLVVEPDRGLARPSFPRLKLSPVAADRFGFDRDAALAVPSEMGKLHLPVSGFTTAPAPLAAVVMLRKTDAAAAADRDAGRVAAADDTLTGMAAVSALHQETFRNQMARLAGADGPLFRLLTELARRVPVVALPSSQQWDGLERLADRVEALAQGGG